MTLGAPDAKGDPAVRIEPRTPGGGAFSVRRDAGRVSVIPKAMLPGKALSLRATASDASGGTVDQTVIRAIPVR